MVNASELVARIIQLTKKEKIFWKPADPFGNRAKHRNVDIYFGGESGWSLRDFLWVNDVKVEISKEDKAQLLNAILEMRRHFATHQEEKKKQRHQEGIKILMEV